MVDKWKWVRLYWFRLTVLLFSSALFRVFIVVLFAYSFAGSIVIWLPVCYLFGYSGFLSNCLALGYSWASSKHIKCAWRVWYALIEAKRRLAPRTRNVPTLWSCVSLKNVLFDHVCLFFIRRTKRRLAFGTTNEQRLAPEELFDRVCLKRLRCSRYFGCSKILERSRFRTKKTYTPLIMSHQMKIINYKWMRFLLEDGKLSSGYFLKAKVVFDYVKNNFACEAFATAHWASNDDTQFSSSLFWECCNIWQSSFRIGYSWCQTLATNRKIYSCRTGTSTIPFVDSIHSVWAKITYLCAHVMSWYGREISFNLVQHLVERLY